MRLRIIFLAMLSCPYLYGQQQLGLRLENYAGVNSLVLNPAGNLCNPLRWDVNLAGAGLFFDNSYVFIEQTNTIDLLKNSNNELEFVLATDREGQTSVDAYVVDFQTRNKDHYAALFAYLEGPSLAMKIGENHTAAFFTRVALLAGSFDIPGVFSYYPYDAWPFYDEFTVSDVHSALISWKEFGVNYAFKMPTYFGYIGFGANIRFLRSYEGAFWESTGDFFYTKLPDDEISLNETTGSFGFSRLHFNGNKYKMSQNGSGLAIDLGATAVLGENDHGDYQYRLSASLLDIGALSFSEAEQHRISIPSPVVLALDDYRHSENRIKELSTIAREFSYHTLNDSTASFISNSFTLPMPTALSVQADASILPHLYANALWMQRFPVKASAPRRSNLLAITPRFEHRWFSASLPLLVYEWERLRFGFAVRLGFLVVGSDNIQSLFWKRDYYGTDFYVAVKFNPFDLHLGSFGNSSAGGLLSHRKGKRVKCYEF